MTVDWTINIGNILVLASFIGTIIIVVFNAGAFKQTIDGIKKDIDDLERTMERMADALTQIAVQHTQINNLQSQLNSLDKRVEDIRRGDGLIVTRRELD